MLRDPAIPQAAIARLARRHHRERQRKVAFASLLPPDYPAPRLKLEWQAYFDLRRFWKRPQIRQFIASYGTDHVLFPNTLDTPEHPKLEEFLRDVGTLAEGEYARSLPKKEMLTLVAGEDAARGAAILEAAAEGGKKRSRERNGITAGRNKQLALEFQRRREKDTHQSDTAIKVAVGRALKGLGRSASIAAINAGLDNLKKSSG